MSGPVLALGGALIGNFFFPGAGAVLGGLTGTQLGWVAGTLAGGLLFQPKFPDGPRLQDLSVQNSSFGNPIPRVYGTYRIAGNVIWAADLVEHAHQSGGGKGGGGGGGQTTYTYSCSFAISICEGPIQGIRKIWADGKLIHDLSVSNTGQQSLLTPIGGGIANATVSTSTNGLTIYNGTETQDADPTLQAHLGQVPAYRGQAYAVFTDLDLTNYGNRIPNLTFEVVVNGSTLERTSGSIVPGSSTSLMVMDPETGFLWVMTSATNLRCIDPIEKVVVANITVPNAMAYIQFCEDTRTVWLSGSGGMVVVSVINQQIIHTVDPAEYGLNNVVFLYNPQRRAMVTIKGNTGQSTEIDVDSYRARSDSHYFSDLSLTRALYLPETHCIYTHGDGNFFNIYDATWTTKIYSAQVGSYSGTNLTYDSTRKRVIVVSGSWSVFTFDVMTYQVTHYTLTPPPDQAVFLESPQYIPAIDRVLFLTGWGYWAAYTADSFELTGARFGADGSAQILFNPSWPDRAFSYATQASQGAIQLSFGDAIDASDISLADVVGDLSQLAGLQLSDLNASDLEAIEVHGFVIARQATVRSSLELLMQAYKFDSVESEGLIKFVPLGADPIETFELDDFVLSESGEEASAYLPLSRADELEMPRSVTIKFSNPLSDYQTGAQTATRQVTFAQNDTTVEFAMAFTDAEAKAVADAALYSAWAARITTSWTSAFKFAHVEPTDVVMVDGNLIRITKRTTHANQITFEGSFETGQVMIHSPVAATPLPAGQSINVPGSTFWSLLDIPALVDFEADAGWYAAATGYNDAWPGAVIFKSSDEGGTYINAALLTAATPMGAVAESLGSFTPNLFDEFHVLTVRVLAGELYSATESAVFNGANMALVGDEVLQFKSAELIAANTYALTGFLRGRLGTSTEGHLAGERFVLLDRSTMVRLSGTVAELNQARLYKGITLGRSLDTSAAQSLTNTGQALKPLAGVQLGGGRDASDNLTINWVRRTRLDAGWQDYVDAPLAESTEAYEIDIYDSGFTVVKRTISVTSSTATYTAAQQVTDFGSTQSSVAMRIYQLSATVGRGNALEGSL